MLLEVSFIQILFNKETQHDSDRCKWKQLIGSSMPVKLIEIRPANGFPILVTLRVRISDKIWFALNQLLLGRFTRVFIFSL